ncbi:MAG: glutamate racemase [Deltaproteobacteria bacterium SG8_13]|nr:MAG: glutamate racemase [Deltaproteobacteria bacterium SG8_13]
MIGVFDSGIGGLTVVRALLEQLPACDIVYLGDTARTPYGSKSPETVTRYALEDTRFLVDQGAEIIVAACNTASSVAVKSIQATYRLPVFEVIRPAVRRSLETSSGLRIGVIGTRTTVESGVYEKRIREHRPEARVYSCACPLLVPLIEEGWLTRPETRRIVKKYLIPLKVRQIDTLILGCTHYPLLSKTIQAKIGRRVTVIDSAAAVAADLHTFLGLPPRLADDPPSGGSLRLFVSDRTDQFEKTARMILGRKIPLEKIDGPL